MQIHEVSVGDIVRVKGYGGFATVLHIEQDGYTPPPRSVPKYRATVEWGPNNTRHLSTAKRNVQVKGPHRTSTLIEDYPLGRLEPAHELTEQAKANEHQDTMDAIDHMDVQELEQLLASLQQQASN